MLMALSEDEDRNVKFAAIQGLGRIEPPKPSTGFPCSSWIRIPRSEKLRSSPWVTRTAVLRNCCSIWLMMIRGCALLYGQGGRMACDPETALEKMGTILEDSFIPVVMSALDVIRGIGGQAERAA